MSQSANHFQAFIHSSFSVCLQLLTVVPSENSLALVYRDKETLRFVKHINCRATNLEDDSTNPQENSSSVFYDFSAVYFE